MAGRAAARAQVAHASCSQWLATAKMVVSVFGYQINDQVANITTRAAAAALLPAGAAAPSLAPQRMAGMADQSVGEQVRPSALRGLPATSLPCSVLLLPPGLALHVRCDALKSASTYKSSLALGATGRPSAACLCMLADGGHAAPPRLCL